ncbi:LacI family DNA-binding transcriptional regulator [Erwinia sorbitola]|uniref:LacI family DNA-binding transcriptional regulator n=1 Tax=Erwinia sorbitola TaxID=2681984 RepID=A0A6I6EH12_9GAMM|nr:LacI family DNA-binding transcriptional regulator [Erwinia sorbitola]MTD28018.1 LacI family DNA-binding transcriptional regulator [Erwinia sorbitola]QGU85716.1 LacI family DNA-binding transcriptional regulator [Erwinia sorbitola]
MSLKAIASALGLSVTTVSRALNGYDDVAEETRQRIQQEARRRGYRPNAVARRLKTGRTNAVGLLFPVTPLPFNDISFVEMMGAIAQSLARADVDLLIIADDTHDDHRGMQRMLRTKCVDALIVAHTARHDSRLIKLQQLAFPFLALGRSELDSPYAWFDFDNYNGPALAVTHYADRGLQRFAWLGSHHDQTFVDQRRQGFLDTLAQRGLAQDACWQVDPTRREGYRLTRQLLAQARRPQVVMADCNMLGDGAAIALREAGFITGSQRIELVVYDGLPADSVISDPVTSIVQATRPDVGQQVAEMVLRLIQGEDVNSLQVLWQPELKLP